MPVPGPRTQFGPDPGYRNPEGREPDFINRWDIPSPVMFAGETPGTKVVDLRGMRLAPGQIRRLYKQMVNYIPATPAYSWTQNRPQPGSPESNGVHGFEITRALRYMTRSLYMGAGIDNTESWGAHTYIQPRHVNPAVTTGAGNGARSQPTVRNRLTSFGSRVPTLNGTVDAAQGSSSNG